MPALGLIPNEFDSIGQGRGQVGVKARNQARFLAAFSASGSILKASRWAKIARTLHHEWMRDDPTYPKRFREAEARAARTLEDEAVRRAHEGLRKPVLYKGKPVFVHGQMLYETEYSDTLMVLLLKGNAPDKFKDRQDLTHKFDGDISKLGPTELENLEKSILAAHPQLALEGKTVVDGTAEVVEPDAGSKTQAE